jgi:radical SAM protein (TIGR01212 family)
VTIGPRAPRPLGLVEPPVGPGGWRTLGSVLRATFGEPVYKVSLDGGYTCPNRDGTRGEGGCVYCAEGSRGLILRAGSIIRQFAHGAAGRHEQRFIAYFQSYSGTYAPLEILREHWRTALAQPGVVGLAISTRPDCLPADVVDALAELAQTTPLWVELGLESADDATLRKLGRAHDAAEFADAARRLAAAGVPVVGHLIFGLPQEAPDGGLRSLEWLAGQPVWGVKIHPFHVIEGAPLAKAWRRGHIAVPELDDYVALAAEAVARMPADWTVHRLTGAAPREIHLAPAWGRQPRRILAEIEARLRARGDVQGCRAAGLPAA